jgi:holo-[acyl-carrier protein] synthase
VILGLGVDLVDVARFEATVLRTPALLPRLFTEGEQRLPVRSLAARFAAKEALAKALGAPRGLHWLDVDVAREESGAPRLAVTGTVAARADALGVTRLHLTLTHDGGMACAVVVAEGGT